MEEISKKSCFLRLKEALINDEERFLIDKSGYYTQKESFDIYCGYLNQLSHFIKDNGVCLLAPFIKKETPLIIAAIISLGGIVIIGDPKMTRKTFVEQISDAVSVDLLISYKNDTWCVKYKEQWFDILTKRDSLKASPLLEAKKDKPSFYFLTSGSTGDNKIVALSEYSFLNHLVRQKSDAGCIEGTSYFCLPLHHIFGCGVLLQNLITGHKIYISDTRNYSFALEAIEKYRCTSIANVPTFFYMLIEEYKKCPHDISSLKYGVMAGGAYSAEQFAYVENSLNITLCSSYGMTEASTVIANSPISEPFLERHEGVGKPFPGVDVIFDDEGKVNMSRGEICFKGYNLMLGYVSKDGLYLPTDKNGYFHTGDIGEVDKRGVVHIVGRKKNIIIRGGENLSPSLIEQKIMSIPLVKDVCVTGLDDEIYGDIVAAYIVCDNNQENISFIKDSLKEILIKRELPSVLIFANQIPLLSSGKHDNQTIKKLLLKEKENNGSA